VLVLLALEGGTHRFSELRRAIGGVSERMLAQTLQLLEGDGLVDRVAYEVVPPHVEYSLTPLGREVTERVRALADWIEASLPRIAESWEEREGS
jgi:DNA-binding HxlR family transcriptional regulator